MILWEDKAGKTACIFGQVESVSPGTGKAQGRKHVVRLSENGPDGTKSRLVDFWNEPAPYKDPDRPRLMSDWASDLTPGEWAIILMDTSRRDLTATAFLHENGVLDIGAFSILLGVPENDGLPGRKGGWGITIPVPGLPKEKQDIWFCGKKQEADAKAACMMARQSGAPAAVLAKKIPAKSPGRAAYAGLRAFSADRGK